MRRAIDPEIAAEVAGAAEPPPALPAAVRARIDYHLAEADRVEALAAQMAPGAGRERFLQTAQEYRELAAWLELTAGRRTVN